MRMRRVMTALVLAGAIALTAPCALFAQRGGGGHAGGFSGGHVGGFSGGHVGGFAGGGFTAPHFTAPSGAFAPRSYPAPRMGMMPRPIYPGPARFSPNIRPYGGWTYGQPNNPAVRRSPYPIGNRGWTNPPYNWHGGNNWHGGDHNGHYYRPPYYGGLSVYPWPYYWWPYYSYGWPWTPYLGGWDSGYDYPTDNGAPPAQSPDQYPDQYPGQYPDQYYPPDPLEPNSMEQNSSRPAYQPAIVTSPGVAIS
ncbi:MAG: hypothetical protein JO300_06800, partial [Silvibacterium sp.]|nr:hypothetical protein [Silvibacterium sp.]